MADLTSLTIFHFPGPILFGAGALRELGQQVRALGANRPLVVTDPGIVQAGLLDRALAPLQEAGLEVAVFSDVQPNPTEANVRAGLAQYRAADGDLLVALGGGSPIDAAKGIRVLAMHPEPLEQYYVDAGGVPRITPSLPPLISIPTTAGTGSEVSRGAVITDTAQNRKRVLMHPKLMSSVSILDPELTLGLPPQLTAITGLDALSHAVETYVGTGFNPLAQGLAQQAVKMIFTWLPQAVEDGANLEARGQMLIASSMGALAFAKGLGATHSLAHALTPATGVPHGLANAILLPHVMEFNLPVVAREYADLARAMGAATGDETEDTAARAAIAAVRQLVRQFELPTTLSEAGVPRQILPRLVAHALADHCHRTNPRPCQKKDLRQLYEAAF